MQDNSAKTSTAEPNIQYYLFLPFKTLLKGWKRMDHENEAKRELRRMILDFYQKRKREKKRNTSLIKHIIYKYFKLILTGYYWF